MKRMLRRLTITFGAVLSTSALPADIQTLETGDPTTLEAVLVKGVQPAPGFWTARRHGKTVLILSTMSPVPRAMQWRATDMEEKIATVQEVLAPPGISVGTDVGLVRGALLWPAYRRSRLNPGKKTLSDVLPEDVLSKWKIARTYYQLPRAVERLRPVHAAQRLFESAMHKRGLASADVVTPFVRQLAKRHHIPVRDTMFRIRIADPKPILKELSSTILLDVPCLQMTLDRLAENTEVMVVRANAWAEGNVEELRTLAIMDHGEACRSAFSNSVAARAIGVHDVERSARQAWQSAMDTSLKQHDRILALVPFDQLYGSTGVLAALTAQGFDVVEP